MKTLKLKINDAYFDKVVDFLELLPKKAVKIESNDKDKKLKEIENEITLAFQDVQQGRTKKTRTII